MGFAGNLRSEATDYLVKRYVKKKQKSPAVVAGPDQHVAVTAAI